MKTKKIIQTIIIFQSMCSLGFGAMLIYALNPNLPKLVDSILILSVPVGFILGMYINYLIDQSDAFMYIETKDEEE